MNPKLASIAVMVVVAILSLPSIIAFQRVNATSLSYSQFALQLGDATWGCSGVTISQSDISSTSSSLTSNVYKKAAQVHADSFYKQYAAVSVITYSIQFSIPYQPKADLSRTYNPQTIESGSEIWRGDSKIKYTAGIQWDLNPWNTTHINVWRNSSWIAVLNIGIIPNQLYRFQEYLDISHSRASWVELDVNYWGFWFTIGQWQSWSSQSNPSWGNDFSWWVSAENISATPNCSLGIGFINTNNWYNPTVSVS